MYKNKCKNNVKKNSNKNLTHKNKDYSKNIQLPRIMKEKLRKDIHLNQKKIKKELHTVKYKNKIIQK